MRRRVVLLLFAISVGGCERGCLTSWLRDRGAGGQAPSGEGKTLDLSGTDCSDGLLRCEGGRTYASRAAHIPASCGEGQGVERRACLCPWETVDTCPHGCIKDGLEIVGPPSSASQLCALPSAPARPWLPGDPPSSEICGTESVACVDGVVRVCDAPGRPARALGTCLNGCETSVSLAPGDAPITDGALAILCARLAPEHQ